MHETHLHGRVIEKTDFIMTQVWIILTFSDHTNPGRKRHTQQALCNAHLRCPSVHSDWLNVLLFFCSSAEQGCKLLYRIGSRVRVE